jgi:hypothetical protein
MPSTVCLGEVVSTMTFGMPVTRPKASGGCSCQDASWVVTTHATARASSAAVPGLAGLLLVIECWAAEIVVRNGLDEMFDIQWVLWSNKVLPEVRNLKGRWMNITTNDVEAFMKDIQIDATSFPGKAFDLIFEMPEPDVGIMTFNRCVAVDQWEAMGRPDILEKNCHSTCPKSMIVTTKYYDPNMKVDILAIPPRVNEGDVCCKWKFSMRDETDPSTSRWS